MSAIKWCSCDSCYRGMHFILYFTFEIVLKPMCFVLFMSWFYFVLLCFVYLLPFFWCFVVFFVFFLFLFFIYLLEPYPPTPHLVVSRIQDNNSRVAVWMNCLYNWSKLNIVSQYFLLKWLDTKHNTKSFEFLQGYKMYLYSRKVASWIVAALFYN